MLNNPFVLGIDLGTSGVRIAIINAKKKNTIHIINKIL
jgi:sugar (pentulose or hexulose) kinase